METERRAGWTSTGICKILSILIYSKSHPRRPSLFALVKHQESRACLSWCDHLSSSPFHLTWPFCPRSMFTMFVFRYTRLGNVKEEKIDKWITRKMTEWSIIIEWSSANGDKEGGSVAWPDPNRHPHDMLWSLFSLKIMTDSIFTSGSFVLSKKVGPARDDRFLEKGDPRQ